MGRNLTIRAAVIALASVGALLGASPAFATNTAYYVDATNGVDSNAGTSQTAAWKTLAKVNTVTFSAGDQILLRAGQQWIEQLKPTGSGVSGNPITIGVYGDGARPLVDGRNVAGGNSGGAAVSLLNVSYWTISGLEVVNNNGKSNRGNMVLGGIPNPGSNRSGILVNNTSGTLQSGITIINNYVHNVNGCFVCSGADPHTNGGIAVLADAMNGQGTGSSSYDGVQILNNVVANVGRTGIVFDDYSTGGVNSAVQSALSNNITISGNQITNIDSDGIIIVGANNNLIEHNRVDTAGVYSVNSLEPGSVGMYVGKANNSIMQFNEVSGVRKHVVDGEAYDVDYWSNNSVVQYNYSHDNEGGMVLLMGGNNSGSNAIVRYNLSVNDATVAFGVFTLSSGLLSGANIYNNTVYIAPGIAAHPIAQEGWSGGNNNTWYFRNNVIVNLGTGTWQVPTGTGTTISNNLIYGNHTSGEPADASKITADPQMISPSTVAPVGLNSVDGYKLLSSSPAVGSGVVIPNNGGLDYFGNMVSATVVPTRGFHEAH